MAGIDIRDDDMSEDSDAKDTAAIANYAASIASSSESMQIEELKKKLVQSETEKFALQQQVAKAQKLTEKQIFHNKITGNPVVVGAVNTMKDMDPCTLWWIVQWGNEYLARFKASATDDEMGALESYKTWTQKEKAKFHAGFKHIAAASAKATPVKATPVKASPFVVDSD